MSPGHVRRRHSDAAISFRHADVFCVFLVLPCVWRPLPVGAGYGATAGPHLAVGLHRRRLPADPLVRAP